jgi:hypothetical protein
MIETYRRLVQPAYGPQSVSSARNKLMKRIKETCKGTDPIKGPGPDGFIIFPTIMNNLESKLKRIIR